VKEESSETRHVGSLAWLLALGVGGLVVIGLVISRRRQSSDLSILEHELEPPPFRTPALRPRMDDPLAHPRR
jgi:hypothetical protein